MIKIGSLPREDKMKKLRVGILGLGRCGAFIKSLYLNDAEFVATCETKAEMNYGLKELYGEDFGFYTDFEEFLKHPGGMDVVIIGNFFHEHAHYAIRCLEEGINVISECLSNATMAEGVALVRAAEKSKAMYILGENYQYSTECLEMKRIYDEGTMGKVLFAEGEYNHGLISSKEEADKTRTMYLRSFEEHWRNHLPRTYYVQHSLAPLMFVTGSRPVRISAMAAYNVNGTTGDKMIGPNVKDRAAIMITQNDDGSVFRVTGCSGWGSGDNTYRVCCEKGQLEIMRDDESLLVNYDENYVPSGKERKTRYIPEPDPTEAELIEKAGGGHGGSDYRVIVEALKHIRSGVQHPLDVYFATTLSSVAILGHRSVLNDGQPYDIPDFTKEEDRLKYENDYETPFYGTDGSKPTIPCSKN